MSGVPGCLYWNRERLDYVYIFINDVFLTRGSGYYFGWNGIMGSLNYGLGGIFHLWSIHEIREPLTGAENIGYDPMPWVALDVIE